MFRELIKEYILDRKFVQDYIDEKILEETKPLNHELANISKRLADLKNENSILKSKNYMYESKTNADNIKLNKLESKNKELVRKLLEINLNSKRGETNVLPRKE